MFKPRWWKDSICCNLPACTVCWHCFHNWTCPLAIEHRIVVLSSSLQLKLTYHCKIRQWTHGPSLRLPNWWNVWRPKYFKRCKAVTHLYMNLALHNLWVERRKIRRQVNFKVIPWWVVFHSRTHRKTNILELNRVFPMRCQTSKMVLNLIHQRHTAPPAEILLFFCIYPPSN